MLKYKNFGSYFTSNKGKKNFISTSTFTILRAKAKVNFDFKKVRKSKVESIRQFKNFESRSRIILCFDFLSKAEVFEGEMDNPTSNILSQIFNR